MKTFVTTFLLAISVAAYAAEKIDGQIVYADRTVDVTFLLPVGLFGGGPDTETLQKGVRYLDESGKKRRLKPTQAKEFRFVYNGFDYRMVSHEYSASLFSGTNIFLLQVADGRVKVFEHKVTSQRSIGPNGAGGMPSTTVSYLLQRDEGPLFQPSLFGFKKQMAEFFSDCPKLVALIEGKEFKRRDLEEIVGYYNEQCAVN